MKDIEDRLKEEYDKVEVPDYMFDTSRVFKRVEEEKKQKNKRVISIAACTVVLLLLIITIVRILPKVLFNNEKNVEEIGNSNNRNITGKINIVSKETSVDISDQVSVQTITINSIQEYVIINGVPYTKVKASIIKSYQGNLKDEIEAYIPGGVFKVKELKDNIKDNLDGISKYKDEDLIEVTYNNTIYIPIAEEGKIYISTLIEKNGDLIVDISKAYGFKEYDPETNIVKDDMGDVELEIDKYLENINI